MRIKKPWYIAATLVAAAAVYVAWAQFAGVRSNGRLEARIVAAYPHDPNAFTQGLAFSGGRLYEGTGRYGSSSIRRVDVETGVIEQMRPLNRNYFGEGIAILDDKLYQLTWQNQLAIVYDLESFDLLDTLFYEGEGWGLTHDGQSLILSDGSATLRFLSPEDFEVERTIEVHTETGPVVRLNELEYVDGEIWANIWYEDRIVRIAPDSGAVLGWIDVGQLYPQNRRDREDVANGIAYDEDSGRLLLTGKNWPQIFEVRLVPSESG